MLPFSLGFDCPILTLVKSKYLKFIISFMKPIAIMAAVVLLAILTIVSSSSIVASGSSPGAPSPSAPVTQDSSPITIMAINHSFVSYNTTKTSYGTVTFPSGPFSDIMLFYENIYVSNPWDYSYQVLLNGVQVASGNTYELQNTTVSENITQYYSVIVGKTVNVTAITAEWEPSYSAYQSVWFVLYPGQEPSNIPNVVIPVRITQPFNPSKNTFPHNVLIPYNTSQVFNVTFPRNVSAGYLNLYLLQNGNDEGWYSNQPPFREFTVSIDNTVVAEIWPYPNIQTGGWDLFLWQPITAIGALLDKPYTFNLAPYVSLLNGTQLVNITVVNNEALWIRPALNFMLFVQNATVHSTFSSQWEETNVYNQTPATNMTTQSIPENATWLNDSQVVHQSLVSSAKTSFGSNTVMSYENITNYVVATSHEYDPSDNIVMPYGTGYLVPYNQTFSYEDMINISTVFINTSSHGTSRYSLNEHMVYTVSMTFIENIVLSSNGSLSAIIIQDNMQQGRYIYREIVRSNQSSLTVRVELSNDQVAGIGAFQGVISNGVITQMTYNHASTWRVDINTASTYVNGITETAGYETIQYAENNSTVNRDGVLIIDQNVTL